MADISGQEIKLFYCYAREDRALRDELEKHLSWLKRRYQLRNWHDREILPGEEWEQAIDAHLNSAQIVLLLISPDFMASDYCFGKEMQRALERHREGICRVIPILMRPTYWDEAPFSHLELLPSEARCITTWPNRDEAFRDVVIGISRTIKDLLASLKTREAWLEEAEKHYNLKRYDEAQAALQEAIHLDPNYARAYYNKSLVLHDLARYQEALSACEQCIRLEPGNARAYYHKGYILNSLNRYEEALQALEQALRLMPDYAPAWTSKGYVLNNMGRYEEALAAFEQGLHINPDDEKAFHGKGLALYNLKRYEEAGRAFEKARQLEQESR